MDKLLGRKVIGCNECINKSRLTARGGDESK